MARGVPISRSEVGAWLRARRRRSGKSQSQVAKAAGITQASVSNYETGKREVHLDTLLRIAAAVDADIGDLVSEAEAILLAGSRLAEAAALLRSSERLTDSVIAARDAVPDSPEPPDAGAEAG